MFEGVSRVERENRQSRHLNRHPRSFTARIELHDRRACRICHLTVLLITIRERFLERFDQSGFRMLIIFDPGVHRRVLAGEDGTKPVVRICEVADQLRESVGRIISIAVVHEFLSHEENSVINIHEVSNRILAEVRNGVLDHNRPINLSLDGSRTSTRNALWQIPRVFQRRTKVVQPPFTPLARSASDGLPHVFPRWRFGLVCIVIAHFCTPVGGGYARVTCKLY